MSIKAVRIDLPADLHEYLTVVLKRYSGAGIDPEEGMALFHLWDFVTKRAKLVELVEIPAGNPNPQSRPNDGVSPLKRGDVEAAVPVTDDADGLGDR